MQLRSKLLLEHFFERNVRPSVNQAPFLMKNVEAFVLREFQTLTVHFQTTVIMKWHHPVSLVLSDSPCQASVTFYRFDFVMKGSDTSFATHTHTHTHTHTQKIVSSVYSIHILENLIRPVQKCSVK